MKKTKPGDRCPFAGSTCQELCWCWDMVDAPGECAAPAIFADELSGQTPRDWYNECVMETME